MKPENKNMLVRGVVGIGNRNSGMVSTDPKTAAEHGTLVAYTHWFRHDDDMTVLEKELNALVQCYSRMQKTSGIMYGYEYKEYRKS